MTKKRILVVEDDMDVAELLLMYFTAQGYEVFHADTGQEGIRLARAKLPNLILLDVMLPDMEGFEVCLDLRQRNLTRYIPTIFLTQRDARADKVSGLQLGADDYITKPFDVEELRLRVRGSIERATRDHLHEPITGLPTSKLIEAMSEILQEHAGWQRLDVRIVGYDVFRDAYGFLTANDALNVAVKVLIDGLTEWGTADDFIGTGERGEFTLFTFAADVPALIDPLKRTFAERAQALYRFTDVERGYLLLDEGTPAERQMPLMHFEITVSQPSVS
ncbi:MAG: response regulator transcription factor [Anaerolineae bacterium]|nr:response regulator transcription factor [Anaerolineae bacterium]